MVPDLLREIAPADVHVVATGKYESVFAEAERIRGWIGL